MLRSWRCLCNYPKISDAPKPLVIAFYWASRIEDILAREKAGKSIKSHGRKARSLFRKRQFWKAVLKKSRQLILCFTNSQPTACALGNYFLNSLDNKFKKK